MRQLPRAWSLTYRVGDGCRYSDNDVRPAAQLPPPTGPVVLNGQMTGAAPGGGYYASFVDANGQQQLYYYPPTQPQPQTLQHSQSMYAGYVMTPRNSQPRHALLSTSLTWGVSRLPTGMRRRTHRPTTRRPTTPTECRRRRTATRTCSRSSSSTRWCLAAGATAVDPTVPALVGAETVAQAKLPTTTRRLLRVWARRTWAMVEQTVATVGDGVLAAVRSPRRTCAHADGDHTVHRCLCVCVCMCVCVCREVQSHHHQH